MKYLIFLILTASFSSFADQRKHYAIDATPNRLEEKGFFFSDYEFDPGSESFGSYFTVVYPTTFENGSKLTSVHLHIHEGEKELFYTELSIDNFDYIQKPDNYLTSDFRYFDNPNIKISLVIQYESKSVSEVYTLYLPDIRRLNTKAHPQDIYEFIEEVKSVKAVIAPKKQ